MGDAVRWVIVYISEAHAQDEWPIRSGRYNQSNGPVCLTQPKATEERAALAREFGSRFGAGAIGAGGARLLVDPLPGEPFEGRYAAWPIRYYVMRGLAIEYVSFLRSALTLSRGCGTRSFRRRGWCRGFVCGFVFGGPDQVFRPRNHRK